MNLQKELIDSIREDYNFIGEIYDKKGKFIGNHYLYSKTIQLFSYQVDEILKLFPNFKITHLYLNWYILGFNKTLKTTHNKMEKLNKTFKINPLYECDGYKVSHHLMLAPDTVREYWTWIPRSLKNMHKSILKMMACGSQLVVRELHSAFQENFFDQPIEVALKFSRDMSKYLMIEYNGEHFEELHKLGYLPIRIQALPEGTFTDPNIPHMAGINTKDGYAWLGLFLETMISKLAWQMPTAATIAAKFKENSVEWVTKTDSENLWLADFMNHDFHSRGGNPFSSIAIGLGHALTNSGSDTLNVIPASRYYYDFDENEVPIYSVNASEHSVTCTGIFYYQNRLKKGLMNDAIKEYYSFDVPCEGDVNNPDYLAISEWLNLKDWLKKFPKGILSYVCDTFNTWKLITYILPRLKTEILARDGKLVIRPDTGDPVDQICGENSDLDFPLIRKSITRILEPKEKGVIELLYDIFGGDKSKEGYIRLDPHIGAIYGDSINLERQVAIYSRLADKGFAATNIVLGVGSYTYIMLTRDSAGYAAKGAWFETLSLEEQPESGHGVKVRQGFDIYKDPATGDGSKKSLKGFQFVYLSDKKEIKVVSQVTEEQAFSDANMLKIIYEDGKFYNQVTLNEIRAKLK